MLQMWEVAWRRAVQAREAEEQEESVVNQITEGMKDG